MIPTAHEAHAAERVTALTTRRLGAVAMMAALGRVGTLGVRVLAARRVLTLVALRSAVLVVTALVMAAILVMAMRAALLML